MRTIVAVTHMCYIGNFSCSFAYLLLLSFRLLRCVFTYYWHWQHRKAIWSPCSCLVEHRCCWVCVQQKSHYQEHTWCAVLHMCLCFLLHL